MNGSHQTNRNSPHVMSAMLSSSEKNSLEKCLRDGWKCLASAVVQVFVAPGPQYSSWVKHCCGVATFIKDTTKRSFYIRILDLKSGNIIFEQEWYRGFQYQRTGPQFHYFAGEDYPVAFNFAQSDDANNFAFVIEKRIEEQKRKRDQRKRQIANGNSSLQSNFSATAPTSYQTNTINTTNTQKKKPGNKKGKIDKSLIGAPTDFKHLQHVGFGGTTSIETNSEKTFDFNDPALRHLLNRAGINSIDSCDSETKKLICQIIVENGGFDAVQKDNQQFERQQPALYAHQQTYNQSNRSRPVPPPPSAPPSHSLSSRGAAPPPPPQMSRTEHAPPPPPPPRYPAPVPKQGSTRAPPKPVPPPPPPAQAKKPYAPPTGPVKSTVAPPPPPQAVAPPPPPPPTQTITSAPPPPPPPPPPSSSQVPAAPPPPPAPCAPVVPSMATNPPPVPPMGDGRANLMDQIKNGVSLSSAREERAPPPTQADPRENLLDAIRKGKTLKPVEKVESKPNPESVSPGGLAGVLAAALKNRLEQTKNDSDESGSDSDEWED